MIGKLSPRSGKMIPEFTTCATRYLPLGKGCPVCAEANGQSASSETHPCDPSQPTRCPHCQTLNPGENRYCDCGFDFERLNEHVARSFRREYRAGALLLALVGSLVPGIIFLRVGRRAFYVMVPSIFAVCEACPPLTTTHSGNTVTLMPAPGRIVPRTDPPGPALRADSTWSGEQMTTQPMPMLKVSKRSCAST